MDFKDIFPKSSIIPYFAYFLAYFLNVCLLPSFIPLTFCRPQYSDPILIVFIKLERNPAMLTHYCLHASPSALGTIVQNRQYIKMGIVEHL